MSRCKQIALSHAFARSPRCKLQPAGRFETAASDAQSRKPPLSQEATAQRGSVSECILKAELYS
jgi:hypothetical protein